MDGQQFDRLARTVAMSHTRTRRQVFAFLATFALAGVRPWRTLAAQGEAGCDVGLTYCEVAEACVDLQSDMNHCGACGAVCESSLVPVECRSGVCERANCPVGVEYCGLADGCRDLSSDPAHCGACANACASGVCTGGVCASSGGACPEGEVECDGVCIATCCNNEHCGECGNACTGGMTCFEGQCDCPSGNCPPVTLPNTGTGAAGATSRGASWPAWAAVGAAALAAIGWSRATPRSDRATNRNP